jgi:hypothetical protein
MSNHVSATMKDKRVVLAVVEEASQPPIEKKTEQLAVWIGMSLESYKNSTYLM